MTTKPKSRKAPAAKPDPARSRRYRISRTRNCLVKAQEAMGPLGNSLPRDLLHIDMEIFRAWQKIRELIDVLAESKA
jgi:hypothetical protein